MQLQDPSNTIFSLAVDLVNDTSQHIFLTGKAGTGKTTFLKHIREHTNKNTVIVAPTGVAAINAGGITMHSFFQLPRGMFVPGILRRDDFIGYAEANDRHSLFRNIHFTTNKRELLQEVELLIIDEVSMVRCDMLDAVDTILRHFRKAPHLAFGGVQVVYIGDMFQLPPVVSPEEWNVLQEHYTSPYFFSAHVIAQAPPVYIELKKIYRQNEGRFIEVLNRIRHNHPTREDFEFLNAHYQPDFIPPRDEHYITVTTHNIKADAINNAALAKLPGKLFNFPATVRDDFSEKAFPADVDLQVKEGAQVMFIKNDNSTERRYFNGKIAVVKKIAGDEIFVSFNDGSNDFKLEKETWKNIRYIYSRESDEIDEEELGSFTQYPIRLAWAITVHKSQGLTFEKAIIDAGASFAPGQVYVALSRCTSMQGVVLKSKIHTAAVLNDVRIVEFARKEVEDLSALEQLLEKEKYRHRASAILKLFDWNKLVSEIYGWMQMIPELKLPDVKATHSLSQDLLVKVKDQANVARKFQKQLEQILSQITASSETTVLEDRMKKAIQFFADSLVKDILLPLQEHLMKIEHTSRIGKYRETVKNIEALVWTQIQKLVTARYGVITFGDAAAFKAFEPSRQKTPRQKSKKREPKGSSQLVTFQLFREGKTIAEIATLRNMAISTIESHLAMLVNTGEIKANELVTPDKLVSILDVINQVGPDSAGLIKSRLGDDVKFHEIRVVLNYYRLQQKQTA